MAGRIFGDIDGVEEGTVFSSRQALAVAGVEQSHLPVKRTLEMLGIPRTSFYRWYDRYQTGGPEALEDRSPMPSRVWNRIPDDVREAIVELALEEADLSPRELAVRFTDTLPAIWPIGSKTVAWSMFAVPRIIHRPRARSSDGTRP